MSIKHAIIDKYDSVTNINVDVEIHVIKKDTLQIPQGIPSVSLWLVFQQMMRSHNIYFFLQKKTTTNKYYNMPKCLNT